MKAKIFRILAAAALCAFGILPAAAQYTITSAPTLESLWGVSISEQMASKLQLIDQFYQGYDMLMNTYQNLENQYRQIQQAVEAAKSIDWENIKFDGDFDIRDDVRGAGKRVNRLLNDVHSVKTALTSSVINIPGGESYSLADLCGAGAEDKDLFTAMADVGGFMNEKMKAMADAAQEKLTPEQRMAVMAKYGISPRNYWMCVQTETMVQQGVMNALGHVQLTTEKLEEETKEAETLNAVVKAAMDTKDENGNVTQGAAMEAIMHLLRNLSEQSSDLKRIMREGIGLQAKQMRNDMQKAEAAADQAAEEEKASQSSGKKLPGRFTTKSQSLK